MAQADDVERFFRPLLDILDARWTARFADVRPIGRGLHLTAAGAAGHVELTPCKISGGVAHMGLTGEGRPHFQIYTYAADDDSQLAEIVRTCDLKHLCWLLEAWRASRALTPAGAAANSFGAEERAHLEAIARGREAPLEVVVGFDPSLPGVELEAEERQTLARALAVIDREMLARNFPRQDDGRLPLDEQALLAEIRGATKIGGRSWWLCAASPKRRAEGARLTLRLDNVIAENASHRWDGAPWLFQAVAERPVFERRLLMALREGQDSLPAEVKESVAPAMRCLRLLDEGRFAEALGQYGIELSDAVVRVLDAVPLKLREAAHAPAWAVALRRMLWECAPWKLGELLRVERERIAAWRAERAGRAVKPVELRLKIFPHQRQQRKVVLTLVEGEGAGTLTLTRSASNARVPECQWKRDVTIDLMRFGH
jgi:hypothetical protein